MQEQEPCTREDIEAVVPHYIYFSADDNGVALTDLGEDDIDKHNVIGYYCHGCFTHFQPSEERDNAWQEALDHLKPDTINSQCGCLGFAEQTVSRVTNV